MSESEVGIVYHHEPCVRIVEETLLDLVEFLRELLTALRIVDAGGLVLLMQLTLHILLQLEAELRTERKEARLVLQIEAVHLIDVRDIHHRIRQHLAHSKHIHHAISLAITRFLLLGRDAWNHQHGQHHNTQNLS